MSLLGAEVLHSGATDLGPSPAASSARPSPAVMCFVLGLFGTLLMVVLTPPFLVPDEQEHFHRAYQLSELQLRGTAQNDLVGAVLPSSLIELSEDFLGTRDVYPKWVPIRHPWRRTWLALQRPLDPDRQEFVNFNMVFYAPLAYLPQAIAIYAGRWAGAGPLALLYLARLANGLVAVASISWAVRLMPIGREALMAAGLLPMAVFEYGSASADALVIAAAFLFTAVALRTQLGDSWTAGAIAIAAASGLVVCAQKPVYAPLLVLALPAGLTRTPTKQTFLAHLAILVVALGGTAFWIDFSWTGAVLPRPGVSVADKVNLIAGHPLAYAATIARSFWYLGKIYYLSLVGILGWMKIFLPSIVYGLAGSALLLSVLAPPDNAPRLPAYAVAWNGLILGGSVVLIMTALYISWENKVGFGIILGIQGRYFIPLLPLSIATALSAIRWRPFRRTSRTVLTGVIPAIIAVDLLIACLTMVRTFEIF